jgi:hypothetical protein
MLSVWSRDMAELSGPRGLEMVVEVFSRGSAPKCGPNGS